MIRVLVEGDEAGRLAPSIRQLARSFPKDVYDPEKIWVVTDDEPVPEDLTGVGLLIENRPREPRTGGPWEVHESLNGYLQIIIGGANDGQAEVVCKVQDNPHEIGNAAAIARVPRAEAALEAVLLFYSAAIWDDAHRERWRRLTGTDEATTKNLCDTVRRALA